MIKNTPLPALDFGNTQLAFHAKSDARLKRTYLMYRMIGFPFTARVGPQVLNFMLRYHLPGAKSIVRGTLFKVFCAGESLEDTLVTTQQLQQFGVRAILDYSVEGEKTEAGFDATCQEFYDTLVLGAKQNPVAFSACKLTGLASFDVMEKLSAGKSLDSEETAAWERVKARMERLAEASAAGRVPFFIDAEESWIQDAIDALAESLMERYNQTEPLIFTTVQLYRHDRLEYLRGLIQRSRERGYVLGVKLVRGAYLEKEHARAEAMGYPTPIQASKEATDHDFNEALRLCIDHIDHLAVCAGTHNEESSRYLTELMASKGLPNNHPRVLFAQLLAMSDHISFNLAHEGYNAFKYLPYGPVDAVFPYLSRRAQENTSVAGQSSRELELLSGEMKRRGFWAW